MSTTPAVAPLVSAVSVMLAAYGFFFNATRDAITEGRAVPIAVPGKQMQRQNRQKVHRARNVAIWLTVPPVVVALVLVKPVVDEVRSAFDVSFALDRYSPVDVLFVLLAVAWVAIAVYAFQQAWSLMTKCRRMGC